ncbi:MAG: hypothetical protein IJ124_13855 [Clostridia bacterium]|nr:hypothetical protein [Clostridia bacterium]
MKHRWLMAWALQIIEMLAAGLLASLAYGAGAGLYAAALWGLVPLAGLLTACRAVRRGLNNYLAWIAPAGCLYAAHFLLWGFSPAAGAALVTAFLSLVGAAAGEVLNQREGRQKR